MRVFVHALLLSRKHLMGMFLIVFILVLFGAVGIREIERDVQPDVLAVYSILSGGRLSLSCRWVMDAVPVTPIGKGFAQVVMVFGVGLTAAFIGIVGSNVYTQVQKMEDEKDDNNQE